MPFLWIAFAAVGLVIVALVLVECAGVLGSVRRYAVGTKESWKAAILAWRAANRALRSARREARKGPATRMVVVAEKELDVKEAHGEAREAGDAVRDRVRDHADELRKLRAEPLIKATKGLKKFLRRLAESALAAATHARVLTIAGSLLLAVLTLIQVLYYARFNFDVYGYLSGYFATDLVLSLLQALVVLLFASVAVIVAILFVLPWSVLQLVKIFDCMRAAVASAFAASFFALCHRSPKWNRLALLLLGDTSVAPASEPGGAGEDGQFRRPSDDSPPSFARKPVGPSDGEGRPFRRLVEPAINIISKLIRGGAGGATILFLFVCAATIWFEPRYLAYSTCHGTRATVAVIDPPLNDSANFTKIGQIGVHVFIVRSTSACGLDVTPSDAKSGTFWDVFDPIDDRWRFLFKHLLPDDSGEWPKSPTDVAVVPVGRVLCMYEDHGDGKESRICAPPPRPDEGAGTSLVYDEWRVKEEIERKLCKSGATISSEPIVFERGAVALADELRAQKVIRAFLGKSELQDAKLHVLGLASGDGDHRYNENLARRRAETVAAEVKKLDGDRDLKIVSWGENHLTNGVANSRSVRLVGCRPEADASADGSEPGARTTPKPDAERGAPSVARAGTMTRKHRPTPVSSRHGRGVAGRGRLRAAGESIRSGRGEPHDGQGAGGGRGPG